MSKTIEKYNLYYKVLDENIFPQEWIVRIFMGKYPKLNIRDDLKNKKILEVSCGDGRNFPPLLKKKMKVYATEVSDVIVNNLINTFPKIKFKQAINGHLPFQSNFFDYLLSWNQIYYMGDNKDNLFFERHVKEFSKVLKKDGKLIVSVPMIDNFIFEGSKIIDDKYRIIKNDPFKVRNEEIMRCFKNEEDIIDEFKKSFKNFVFASSINDHFGIQNNWHIFVCQKK